MKYLLKKINNLECEVWWNDFDDMDQEEVNAKKSFEQNIIAYIQMFKHLPLCGLYISNEIYDSAKIGNIVFDGINNKIIVNIEWK